jgi:hypothetical protein
MVESPHSRWNINGPVFYVPDTVSWKIQFYEGEKELCDINLIASEIK